MQMYTAVAKAGITRSSPRAKASSIPRSAEPADGAARGHMAPRRSPPSPGANRATHGREFHHRLPRPPRTSARAGGRRRVAIIPLLELLLLAIFALAPLVLEDYLTVFVTRVLILALLAISFDLVWGYAGIMSFGQALFFGTAGYGVALLARDLDITSVLVVLPAAMPSASSCRCCSAGFLLLGRRAPSDDLRRARAPSRDPTPPNGWRAAGIISAARTASRRSPR